MSLETFVHCQTGKAKDGQWISRQAPAQVLRRLFRNHLPAGDGDESSDVVTLDGDVGHSDVVSELILSRMALKEAVEVDVSATKS